jgi:hypothetical protein
MSGYILHVGISAICPHGGQVSEVSSNTRVSVSNQKIVTSADTFPIAGCAFNISGASHPCVTVKWIIPATRVKVGGQPVLLVNSTALCQAGDQAPQGPPSIISTQIRVRGT